MKMLSDYVATIHGLARKCVVKLRKRLSTMGFTTIKRLWLTTMTHTLAAKTANEIKPKPKRKNRQEHLFFR